MNVLIACEYSGRVRDAFLKRGHNAVSCDLLPTESKLKGALHYQGDVRDILNSQWDLMIAHPPCTYLTSAGLHWNSRGRLVDGRPRSELTDEALDFVNVLLSAPIKRKALENPVGCISTRIRKPDQTIQPWQFGEDASKSTCLWLQNLPPLQPTKIIEGVLYCCGEKVQNNDVYGCVNCCCGEKKAVRRWSNQTPSGQNKLGPGADRWKLRSTTYQGIAEAMAEQWGNQ